ncbi:pseudouridine synthase [Lachnotalea glycerini]|jgi:16S rRNA pseudouridine516 synthase|uniref:Pseudouridine synthase n=1 Tax=Lachnotalea glycerini TaxID=1763509 RepID=A0A255IGG1_9FIRM|nr:pseudouridine synthase [Lachnotalea glycerini]PXV95432.1 pseudouridine synthase [Lachnotalea glycerini]RDY32752.1 rRNA pseudouridine synthase [Lachnotalea glycerini]
MRLDKFLSEAGIGSRSQVKTYIRKGLVSINQEKVCQPELKINIENDVVQYNGSVVEYTQFEYFMLNKPQNVVSATKDNVFETVVGLIRERKRDDLFPVGRLDKDTEGLLIITNDGELSHNMLSPRKHVNKTYYAKISGLISNQDQEMFEKGLDIGDDKPTLPAKLTILKSDTLSEIELTIQEGRFHQVKRMFEAVGKKVLFLKRIEMGGLKLDEKLMPGEYRCLTKDEIDLLRRIQC